MCGHVCNVCVPTTCEKLGLYFLKKINPNVAQQERCDSSNDKLEPRLNIVK